MKRVDGSNPSSAPASNPAPFEETQIAQLPHQRSSLEPHPDAQIEEDDNEGCWTTITDTCQEWLYAATKWSINAFKAVFLFLYENFTCLFYCGEDEEMPATAPRNEIHESDDSDVSDSDNEAEEPKSEPTNSAPVTSPQPSAPAAPTLVPTERITRAELHRLLNTKYDLPPVRAESQVLPSFPISLPAPSISVPEPAPIVAAPAPAVAPSIAVVVPPAPIAPARSAEDLRIIKAFELPQEQQDLIDVVFASLIMLYKYGKLYRTRQFYIPHLMNIQDLLNPIHPLVFAAHLLTQPHLACSLKILILQNMEKSEWNWWSDTGDKLKEGLELHSKINKQTKKNNIDHLLPDFVRYLEIKKEEWSQNVDKKLSEENRRLREVGKKVRSFDTINGKKLKDTDFIKGHKWKQDFENIQLKKSDLDHIQNLSCQLSDLQKMFKKGKEGWNDFFIMLGDKLVKNWNLPKHN